MFPELQNLFSQLRQQGRAMVDYRYRLPILEQDCTVPFAYRNGTLNLVKPQEFLVRPTQKALELATQGSLIRRHGLPDEPRARLVVVSRFESTCEPELVVHVDRLLTEYEVTHVPERELNQFVNLIESEAHG